MRSASVDSMQESLALAFCNHAALLILCGANVHPNYATGVIAHAVGQCSACADVSWLICA
jgi:hypothetical protein